MGSILGRRALVAWAVALSLAAWGCGPTVRRFTLAPPLWEDPDRNHVPCRPQIYYSALYADAIDKTLLRPLTQIFAVPVSGESINVNAYDEVPNSSWFKNRIGLFPLTPEEVIQGACQTRDMVTGPWVVTRAKAEGITPGFFARGPDGENYLLKVDGLIRPERGTTADVVGAMAYHVAGYHAPCTRIILLDRSAIRLAPSASFKDPRGVKQPFTRAHLEAVLALAIRLPDGKYRFSASQLLHGMPLGPFRYSGTRHDDPNDVVPHQDRRELRAAKLIAAWLDRFDTREQNSLDMFVQEKGRYFIRHYQLDFGEAFGSPWTTLMKRRRVGHSYFLDLRQIFEELVTLGLMDRPWFKDSPYHMERVFASFGWRNFDPAKWKPVYPNPAFDRMTWRDALWMTRIIVRFRDDHIRAMVKEAQMAFPGAEEYLIEALMKRRDRIAREYLGQYVPLDRFHLVRQEGGQNLCFEDLAIRYAGVKAGAVAYWLSLRAGPEMERLLSDSQARPDPSGITCVRLPLDKARPSDLAPPGAPPSHPLRYGTIRIEVLTNPPLKVGSVTLHTYDQGPQEGLTLVGIERGGPCPSKR